MNSDRTVVIALGSNLGDSRQILADAIEQLRDFADGEFRASLPWRTKPIDCPSDSPDFVNAVVVFEAKEHLNADSLLRELQAMEDAAGRRPKEVLNEPRPLDLDIVAFGGEVRDAEELTIPHPRAHLRRFVLDPLAEVHPFYRAPNWGGCARELAANLSPDDRPERLLWK